MSINEIQEDIIKDFIGLDEWMDKYEYLIKLGKSLGLMDAAFKTEESAISGCQSKVWVKAEMKGNKIRFYAESDTLITKGLIALLLRVMDNQSPEDIVNTDLYFIDRIGLSSNLSPSRANGLASIVKHMKRYASQAMNSGKSGEQYPLEL